MPGAECGIGPAGIFYGCMRSFRFFKLDRPSQFRSAKGDASLFDALRALHISNRATHTAELIHRMKRLKRRITFPDPSGGNHRKD